MGVEQGATLMKSMNRRYLINAFLAAPIIIRTPGLLMAIKPIDPTWLVRIKRNAHELEILMRPSAEPYVFPDFTESDERLREMLTGSMVPSSRSEALELLDRLRAA